eukprot:GHVN01074276.1.p2 GENE.GHVN01074276.1~~GHVN01074276.1.p2  ORF type:complete len:379 (+),score=56.27 GHVN01074276.1:94-1230(+)
MAQNVANEIANLHPDEALRLLDVAIASLQTKLDQLQQQQQAEQEKLDRYSPLPHELQVEREVRLHYQLTEQLRLVQKIDSLKAVRAHAVQPSQSPNEWGVVNCAPPACVGNESQAFNAFEHKEVNSPTATLHSEVPFLIRSPGDIARGVSFHSLQHEPPGRIDTPWIGSDRFGPEREACLAPPIHSKDDLEATTAAKQHEASESPNGISQNTDHQRNSALGERDRVEPASPQCDAGSHSPISKNILGASGTKGGIPCEAPDSRSDPEIMASAEESKGSMEESRETEEWRLHMTALEALREQRQATVPRTRGKRHALRETDTPISTPPKAKARMTGANKCVVREKPREDSTRPVYERYQLLVSVAKTAPATLMKSGFTS